MVALLETRCTIHVLADETGTYDLKGHKIMLFSDDPVQITSLNNIQGSITPKPLSSRIFIFSSQGKTQSVSENTISPPCTVQVPPVILSSSPKELFSFYLPLQKG